MRGVLVAGQVALALVLLVGAGLMTHSFARALENELGADPTNLLTFDFRLPSRESFKGRGMYRMESGLFDVSPVPAQTVERVFERLQTVPGVLSVAAVSAPPFVGQGFSIPFLVDGHRLPPPQRPALPPANSRRRTTPRSRPVSSAMSIPSDTAAISVHTIAQTHRSSPSSATRCRGSSFRTKILSVVTCGSISSPTSSPARSWASLVTRSSDHSRRCARPAAYVPHVQQGPTFVGPFVYQRIGMTFVLRTAGDPLAMLAEVKRAVAEIDRDDAGGRREDVEQTLDGHLQQLRLSMWLLGMFGAMAALLAATGLYGVIAYSVAQRTREFGVRMALGATASSVLAMVLRYATHIVVAGLGVGFVAAFLLSRVLEASLFQVTRNRSRDLYGGRAAAAVGRRDRVPDSRAPCDVSEPNHGPQTRLT